MKDVLKELEPGGQLASYNKDGVSINEDTPIRF